MPKKGVNIHKRKDGRWEGRYKKSRKSGSIIYGYVYGKTYTETKAKLENINYENQKSKEKNTFKNILFCDVLSLWLQHCSIRQKGATIAKYEFLIEKHILPQLGNLYISSITIPLIEKFIKEKLLFGSVIGKTGLSPSYVKSIAIIIESALNYASEEGLCDKLPSKITKPIPDKKELQILNIQQQKTLECYLQNNCSLSNFAIMISLHTGLRIGEICALSWDDIDLNERIIHVRHTVARVIDNNSSNKKTHLIIDAPKTKSSKRDIPIPTVLFSKIVEAKSQSKSKYIISETNTFLSPRTLEYRYHKVLSLCNIESVNFHALRHTFATRCIEVGVDVKTLSEILGHSNVSITLETYVHSSMQLKRSQLEKLSSISA